MPFNPDNFSKSLIRLMKENNISPKEVSGDTNISIAAIYQWINGGRIPLIENIYELAEYFGVSIDCIVGYNGDEEKNIDEKNKE